MLHLSFFSLPLLFSYLSQPYSQKSQHLISYVPFVRSYCCEFISKCLKNAFKVLVLP